MNDMLPILIGVGQAVEQVPSDLTQAASHADMAGRAAAAALTDAGVKGLAARIDRVACVRTFSDSSPNYACPFGGPNKFPRAVAARIGANPTQAIYDIIGGQTPQTLVGETAQALLAGECKMTLIAGGEALANMRAAQRAGAALDWSETHAGDWDDRGLFSGPMFVSQTELAHGLMDAMSYYGFIETARRMSLGRTVAEHRAEMSELMAPFSHVAADNPYAMFPRAYSAKELATPTADNRPLVTPYLKHLVAKDGINQGAAVLMTTVGLARELGIDEAKWVYLRAHADVRENLMLERTDLGASVAMDVVMQGALEAANLQASDIDAVDIYSCFPVVVEMAKSALGPDLGGNGILTLTGGLPFFGGPGNNYTLHGIAEAVTAARATPGSLALAHGNGGWMSKQAVGIYSTDSGDGPKFADTEKLANQIKAQPHPEWTATPAGQARIESYIVTHRRGAPTGAIIIGRLLATDERFYAKLSEPTDDGLKDVSDGKMDGAEVQVETGAPANKFHFI